MAAKQLPLVSPSLVRDSQHETRDDVGTTISEATSHDLVFAVIGHAGAGATRVAQRLLEGLRSKRQTARPIKMSKLIAEAARKLDATRWASTVSEDRLERTRALQDAGNWLRETKGLAFTAGLAVRQMHEYRMANSGENKRIAFVIDCLKNKHEVDALRKVYGRSFYLISVICPPDVRFVRLREKYKGLTGSKEEDASRVEGIETVARRDEDEDGKFGQQVRKTIQLGDFFVNNEANNSPNGPDPLSDELARFLQLVFGTEVVRPRRDERGMYIAWSAALRSSCMSRQVGAAILHRDGQVIATGTNDVPRFGGGLYEEADPRDFRCFRYAKPEENEPFGFCRNDKAKEEIYREIFKQLEGANLLQGGINSTDIRKVIEKTPVKDLIEFSRAVHAEMDALISIARSGGVAARDATLYCTTYPCHSCARHIVAAGIKDVIYIEPYTKSRAIRLHDDTIREAGKSTSDEQHFVEFRLFTGVAPRRFAALFEMRDEIKKNGRLRLQEEADALHQDPIFTKSHLDFESTIATNVSKAVEQGGTS